MGADMKILEIQDLKTYNPLDLTDEQLSDDWRIVAGWWSNLKLQGKFKYSAEEIIDLSEKILKEIIRRSKVEFHPETWTEAAKELYLKVFSNIISKGIYLVEPHGEYIYTGKKKLIVKSRSFIVGSFYILVSDKKAYGYIRLKEPYAINIEEFNKLKQEHLITDDERLKWWSDTKTFYIYAIRDFIPLPEPLKVIVPQGVQTFINKLDIKEQLNFDPAQWDAEKLAIESDSELINKLKLIYDIFKERGSNPQDEEVINAYILLTDEIEDRNLDYIPVEELETYSGLLRKGIRQPFSGPGGKSLIAKEIVSYFPEHKIYVEPFVGGGIILFKKKPSDTEIINDLDPQIYNAWITLKESDSEKIRDKSKDFDWISRKERVKELWKSNKHGIPGLLDFLYGLKGSFSGDRKSISPTRLGLSLRPAFSNLEKIKERLEKVKIFNSDYKKLKRYDSKETFYYFDPPYEVQWKGPVGKDFQTKDFVEFLEGVKGKFIVSCSLEHKKFFEDKGWHFKTIERPTLFGIATRGRRMDKEIIVSNFKFEKNREWLAESSNLDKYVLDIKSEIDKIGNIVLVPNYMSWTGSTLYAKNRLPNDLDIVIRDRNIDPSFAIKINRLIKKLTGIYPCLHASPFGPNWRHFPLYNLALVPTMHNQFVEVGLEEPGFATRFYEQARAAGEKQRQEAELSLKEDKIEMFRFFYGLKPVRAANPGERMTKEFFISLFTDEDYKEGIYSSKKYDGLRAFIYKSKDKVEIWSEDGENLSDRLPTTITAVKKLNVDDVILDTELEKWHESKHQPRESVAGYMHEKGEPDDKEIVTNVFTCLYYNGEDLHKKNESERQEYLNKIKFEQATFSIPDLKYKLNLVPNLISHSKKELVEYLDFVEKQVASEGIVAKKANSIYYLDTNSREGWVKWHHNALLYGIVLKRNTTKVETIFNYDYGILPGKYKVKEEDLVKMNNKNYIRVGTTFNTDEKKEIGDLIAVEFETLNLIEDKNTDTYSVSAWVPRYIDIDNTLEEIPKEANTLEEVVSKAERNRVLQEKHITKDGVTIYEAKQELESYPQDYAVLISHFRGKSAHLDFRRKQDGFLEGETIFNLPEGLITEDVDTIEKGKKWSTILFKEGKFRPDMDPNKKVVMTFKAKQPLVWLNVREVVYPPGSVGATRYEEGVFITMDEGMVYPGVNRPYFKEFFFDMKHFKGRMVERLIGVAPEWDKPPKGVSQWQAWINMEDQLPYILSKRQRVDKRDYVPKDSEKAIPPEWEKRIKDEHKWWIGGLDKTEKIKRLDLAFNYLINQGFINAKKIELKEVIDFDNILESKGRFTLRWHWWMGPKVVRGLPATDSRFELLIDSNKDYLDRWDFSGEFYGDPTKQEEVSAIYSKIDYDTTKDDNFTGWMDFEGSIAPKDAKLKEVEIRDKLNSSSYLVIDSDGKTIETKETFARFKKGQKVYLDQWENIYPGEGKGEKFDNPNERLPVFMDIKDTASVELIEDSDLFKSFKFNGDLLKGYYVLRREDPKSEIWIFSKGRLPGEELKDSDTKFISSSTQMPTFHMDEFKFPVEIFYQNSTYSLISTKNHKLILNKNGQDKNT